FANFAYTGRHDLPRRASGFPAIRGIFPSGRIAALSGSGFPVPTAKGIEVHIRDHRNSIGSASFEDDLACLWNGNCEGSPVIGALEIAALCDKVAREAIVVFVEKDVLGRGRSGAIVIDTGYVHFFD